VLWEGRMIAHDIETYRGFVIRMRLEPGRRRPAGVYHFMRASRRKGARAGSSGV
jgi:hypothetical protein